MRIRVIAVVEILQHLPIIWGAQCDQHFRQIPIAQSVVSHVQEFLTILLYFFGLLFDAFSVSGTAQLLHHHRAATGGEFKTGFIPAASIS
jgi:hypothetical protein